MSPPPLYGPHRSSRRRTMTTSCLAGSPRYNFLLCFLRIHPRTPRHPAHRPLRGCCVSRLIEWSRVRPMCPLCYRSFAAALAFKRGVFSPARSLPRFTVISVAQLASRCGRQVRVCVVWPALKATPLPNGTCQRQSALRVRKLGLGFLHPIRPKSHRFFLQTGQF